VADEPTRRAGSRYSQDYAVSLVVPLVGVAIALAICHVRARDARQATLAGCPRHRRSTRRWSREGVRANRTDRRNQENRKDRKNRKIQTIETFISKLGT